MVRANRFFTEENSLTAIKVRLQEAVWLCPFHLCNGSFYMWPIIVCSIAQLQFQDTDPIVTMTTVADSYEVGLFYSVKYYVDVEFPENTISDYVLDVRIHFYFQQVSRLVYE